MTRKEVILQAASRLFSDKGFNETSISDISEITKVAEGTIFYHYKSKEGLFLAILEGLKMRLSTVLTDTSRKKNLRRAWTWWKGPSAITCIWPA